MGRVRAGRICGAHAGNPLTMARLGRERRELWKASVEDEVDAEFDFHVEMRTREYIERGMDPAAARAAAVARFGDIRAVNDECRTIGNSREREMHRTEYLSELAHDVKFAFRQLLKAPVFTAVAVFTLAIGVGATTAIFSTVEAVVLRPFPYPQADRLDLLYSRWHDQDGNVSVGDFADWRTRASSFSSVAAIAFKGMTISSGDTPDRVTGAQVTASFFPTMGIRPQIGHVFDERDDQPGAAPLVVLSDGLWRRSFAADQSVVGRTMTLDGRPATIIGVMPADFDPVDAHEALWTQAAFTPDRLAEHDEHYLIVVARRKADVTMVAAQHEMDAIAARMTTEYPKTDAERSVRIQPLTEAIVGDYRTKLFVLLGAVGCVLLIACGNVANLLLARGAARAKEIAIRTAIGAGRTRIVRQLLTESLVLAMISTVVGLVLAWAGVRVLIGAAPATIPRLASTRIDGWVFLFALGVAAGSSVIFGLIPAMKAARGDLQQSLREGGRTALASTRDSVRSMLVAAEVAIALMLLVGAGLLIRSAIYLNHVNPGFDPSGVLSARVALRATEHGQGVDDAAQTFDRIVQDIKGRAGVQSAALTSQAPMGPGGGSNGLIPEGKSLELKNAVDSRLRIVTPGYLATMRIPLLEGRDVDEHDISGGLHVMIVSATLAKTMWPNGDAIGKRVACCEGGPNQWKTVIGVAADVRSGGPTQDFIPEFYLPMAQVPADAWSWVNRTMTVVARASNGDAASLTSIVRSAVKTVDASIPVYGVSTMNDQVAQSMAESRFNLVLLVVLGAIGLILAAAGIYSVISYVVTLRTHEIGVRMALGATARDVIRLMTLQGLRPVIAGAAIGGVAAVWTTRLLHGSLYGVQASDPATFVATTATLLAVAVLAIVVPARRATMVDPTTALHG